MMGLNLLQNDIRFQVRHGFYYAYLVVTLFYILIFRVIPPEFRQLAATLIIFSDPSALGLFFIGGIILLEKGQQVFDGLFVTPVRVSDYLLAKVSSLGLISLATSIIIALASGLTFNLPLLMVGVLLTSLFFTLLGMTLALVVKNLNQYIIISPLYVLVFFLPILEVFGLYSYPLFFLLPGRASLVLIEGAFAGLSWGDFVYGTVTLLIWVYLAYRWAANWFYRFVILNLGGGGR